MNSLSSADIAISVVVCTYNRLSMLQQCLASLDAQTVAPKEILIVDNNSSDGTREWILNQAPRQPLWVYEFESNQGLSHARNRGWRKARGEFVAFLDDDGIAETGWIEGILRTLIEVGRDLAAFGGPYFPFYNDVKPEWFVDRFGMWDGGRRIRAYRGGECICGGNMVLRRDVLERVGGFSPALGMRGSVRSFGEESEVHLKIKQLGLKTSYSPHFPIRHLVKKSQYEVKNLLRDSFRAGRNAGQLALVGESKFISLLKIGVTFVAFPIYFFKFRAEKIKTRVLDGVLPLYRRMGYLFGLFER